MPEVGSKLTALAALSGNLATTDLVYVVRGGTQYKATVSQLRVLASQVSDSTTLGRALLTATDAAAALALLEVGDLATEDTIGTSLLDDQAVTLDKMANLAEDAILIGNATNRPEAFATTDLGQALMAAASVAAARTALELEPGAAVPDAAGGATVDAEARAAINALLAELRTLGLITP